MARSAARPIFLGLIVCFLAVPGPAAAADQFVGIPAGEFADHYRPQRAARWCWASCLEMALSYAGIAVPQEELVARGGDRSGRLGALPSDVIRSANGLFETTCGVPALVSGQFVAGAPPAAVLYNHLRRRAPAILLYERDQGDGHAVLVTGIEVASDPEHGITVTSLHVFDPSLGAADLGGLAADGRAYRRVFAVAPGTEGVGISRGRVDGVVLLDSTPLGAHHAASR